MNTAIILERSRLRDTLKNPSSLALEHGKTYYVVSHEWIKRWMMFVDFHNDGDTLVTRRQPLSLLVGFFALNKLFVPSLRMSGKTLVRLIIQA